MAKAAVGVSIGTQHPDYPDLRARTPRVQQLTTSDGLLAFEVEWEYEQFSLPGPDDGGGGTSTTFISKSSTLQWIDAWRVAVPGTPPDPLGPDDYAQLSLPDLGTARSSRTGESGDIGGKPVDSSGQATSIATYQQKLDITHLTDDATEEASFDQVVGRRNDQSFLGRAAGSIVYTGHDLSFDSSTGKWRYVHHFSYEYYRHIRQVVWKDKVTGQATLGTSSTRYEGVGYPVHAVQPYPVRDSYSIFNAIVAEL